MNMKINRLLHSKLKFKISIENRAKNLSNLSGLTYQECLRRMQNRDYQWENDIIINSAKKAGDNLINLLQQQTLEKVKREVGK